MSLEGMVTIIIKTLLRPRSLCRCVASIREGYPDIRILVADDSGYRSYTDGCGRINEYHLLPRDSGASYGRNFLARLVETPYVMVVDDDTVFDASTRLEYATQILDTTPDLDLVAGFYRPAEWWGCLEVDLKHGTLKQQFKKIRRLASGFPLYDFVPQFYVARTEKIREVGWDDELKTLDHLQFFWRARGKLNATVLPYFSAHNTSERNAEYDKLRLQRIPHYRRIQLHKLGKGIHQIEDVYGQDNLEQYKTQLDSRAYCPIDVE